MRAWPNGAGLALSIVVNVEEGFTYHMDDFSRDVPFWETVVASVPALQD